MKHLLSILLLLLFNFSGNSQKTITYFGIDLLGIVPINVLGIESIALTGNAFNAEFYSRFSTPFGASLRFLKSETFAIETGLYFTNRNIGFKATPALGKTTSGEYTLSTYEIPVQGQFFVKLKKQVYLGVFSGLSFNWTASNVGSGSKNDEFYQLTFPKKMNIGYLAGINLDVRTKKAGILSFGVKYNNFFQNLAVVDIKHLTAANQPKLSGALKGAYIAPFVRYFLK